MAVATLTAPGLEVTLKIAEKFQQTAALQGRIKVEIWYETDKPKHLSSFLLRDTFGFDGKFVESAHVLLRPECVYDMSEAYWDTLERLKDSGIVSPDAEFFGYEIRLEDKQTLAWVM
jgi:hypothetical protein